MVTTDEVGHLGGDPAHDRALAAVAVAAAAEDHDEAPRVSGRSVRERALSASGVCA